MTETLLSQLRAGVRAFDEKRWDDAEVPLQAAVKSAGRLGPENPLLAVALYYLASTQDRLGRSREAQTLFAQSIGVFDARSDDDPELRRLQGLALNDLGVLHARNLDGSSDVSASQSEFNEAERLFQRALAVQQKALGPTHSDVVQTLGNLVRAHRSFATVLRKVDRETEAQEHEAHAREFLARLPKHL